jgi:hypothetical protein
MKKRENELNQETANGQDPNRTTSMDDIDKLLDAR